MNRTRRGQATVELALALLVFVPLLIYGIHFAEIGYLSTRVQQGAAFALYDAMGEPTHVNGNQWLPHAGVVGLASSKAEKYFEDFDAVGGADYAVAPASQVYTSIEGMDVHCEKDRSLRTHLENPRSMPTPFLETEGGIRCRASATLKLLPGLSSSQLTVCATSRPRGTRCGMIGLLVGDFSLQGADESRSNDLFARETSRNHNPAYSDLVEKAANLTGCPRAKALTGEVTGEDVPEACEFQFSFMGVEKDYRQDLRADHARPGDTRWLTGGTASQRDTALDSWHAFLGVKRFEDP